MSYIEFPYTVGMFVQHTACGEDVMEVMGNKDKGGYMMRKAGCIQAELVGAPANMNPFWLQKGDVIPLYGEYWEVEKIETTDRGRQTVQLYHALSGKKTVETLGILRGTSFYDEKERA